MLSVACLYFPEGAPVNKVADCCLRFSPQICIRGNSAVFLEIGKCRRLYSEATFLARIEIILRRLNLTASVAIGKDIPDALLKAKYKTKDHEGLSLDALVDLADPFERDPVVRKYVLKLIGNFDDLGIKTLAQFKQIPLKELSNRFGAVGILCQQRARGESGVTWPLWKPEQVIQEREEFLYFDYGGLLEPVLFSIKKMLDQIFYRLTARGLHLQSLKVRITTETTSLHRERFREFDLQYMFPQSQTKGALTIIKERLDKDFRLKPIRTTVEAIDCIVTSTVSGNPGQRNLLHDREEKTEQLHTLLNQLRETYGQASVFKAALTEDRRPERSWRKLEGKEKPEEVADLNAIIPLRPTYLMKMERVEISNGLLYVRRQPKKITKWFNTAEKISGAWADNIEGEFVSGFDRTYFQLELDGGARVFIFETPNKEYFLHGYFG